MFPPVDPPIAGPFIGGFDGEGVLVPDGIDTKPHVGIRQWKVTMIEGRATLQSVSYHYGWAPGVNDASCPKRRPADEAQHSPLVRLHERAAYPGCVCGFWAFANTDEDWYHTHHVTWAMQRPVFYVEGIIHASGLITRGTKGFRAERAQVVALVGPAETTQPDPDWILTPATVERRRLLDFGIFDELSAQWADAGQRLEWFPSREAMLAAHPLTDLTPKES